MTGGMTTQEAAVESLISWWQLAGVEDWCAHQPVNWLEAPPAAPKLAPRVKPALASAHAPQPGNAPVPGHTPAATPTPPFPATLEALHERLRRTDDLPGTHYGQMRALPHGALQAPLMIISDCPDEDDLASGTILSGTTGTLLRNMLSAIGIDLAACYRASLSVTRPPSGRLPVGDLPQLADLMRSHIALAAPANLLILGTAASEALVAQPIAGARAHLHEFNHDGGRKALVATYHPRTLLRRPHCKRPAWDDLQLLLKEGTW